MNRADASELTVVIPTWNQARLLQGCLASLSAQTRVPGILVVDDGSTDETASILSGFPEARHLRLDQNLGFARAVNRGVREVTTPYLALLNNDTEAHPQWVERGLEGFARYPRFSFFASRIVNYFDRRFLDSAGDCYLPGGLPVKRGAGRRVELFDASCEVLGASAGAAFYRRSLFEEAGLLDEDFYMYLEDVEFSLRARMLGHRCRYLPGAIVYHMEAASDPGRVAIPPAEPHSDGSPPPVYYSSRRVFWITRNRWNLMILYQSGGNTVHLIGAWLKSAGFHLFKAGLFGAFAKGIWAGLGSTPRTWRKRRRWKQRCKLTARQRRRLFRMC